MKVASEITWKAPSGSFFLFRGRGGYRFHAHHDFHKSKNCRSFSILSLLLSLLANR